MNALDVRITRYRMYAIPTPAIAGRLIGSMDVGFMKCNVYWNDEAKLVVFNMNSCWYASEDTNTIQSVRKMIGPGFNINMNEFRLYEHGKDVTRQEDIEQWPECDWSDYAQDNLCIRADFAVVPQVMIPGGEP